MNQAAQCLIFLACHEPSLGQGLGSSSQHPLPFSGSDADHLSAPCKTTPCSGASTGSSPSLEGAVGPLLHSDFRSGKLSLEPGFYLRYRRLSISNNHHFAVRRDDDLFRGIGLDVSSMGRWNFNLGLRLDRGGRASTIESLVGHDSIPGTLRLRASASYHLSSRWNAASTWTTDIAGKGGGQTLDLNFSRDEIVLDGARWNFSFGLRAADARFQRLRFGVSPKQAEISQLPVFRPSSGWVSASAGSSLRFEMPRHWVSFIGVSISQPLGAQRQSPLVPGHIHGSIQAGIAKRF